MRYQIDRFSAMILANEEMNESQVTNDQMFKDLQKP